MRYASGMKRRKSQNWNGSNKPRLPNGNMPNGLTRFASKQKQKLLPNLRRKTHASDHAYRNLKIGAWEGFFSHKRASVGSSRQRKTSHDKRRVRYCLYCGEKLPKGASLKQLYCNESCRQMAYQKRVTSRSHT